MTQHSFSYPAMVVLVLLTFISLQAAAEDGANQAQLATTDQASSKPTAIGRPVRIVSFSFSQTPYDQVLARVEQEAALGADLIALPETWRGQKDDTMEPLDGQTTQALSVIAKKYKTYILSPLDIVGVGAKRRNTAVLIDRQGRIVGTYEKAYPFWSEFDHKQPVEPGTDVPVFETDFGRLGVAICFDANFPEVWQQLDDGGAEVVIWPSAYSAGQHLQAYALLHHFYIVSATWTGDCQVYDISGRRLVDSKGPGINVTRVELDLDRGLYHENFNMSKRDQLLKDNAGVIQEDFLEREQWFILKATKPGVSARDVARKYGLEELRDYIGRSRRSINKLRTKQLASKPAPQP